MPSWIKLSVPLVFAGLPLILMFSSDAAHQRQPAAEDSGRYTTHQHLQDEILGISPFPLVDCAAHRVVGFQIGQPVAQMPLNLRIGKRETTQLCSDPVAFQFCHPWLIGDALTVLLATQRPRLR